jgi:hypothetical protein
MRLPGSLRGALQVEAEAAAGGTYEGVVQTHGG